MVGLGPLAGGKAKGTARDIIFSAGDGRVPAVADVLVAASHRPVIGVGANGVVFAASHRPAQGGVYVIQASAHRRTLVAGAVECSAPHGSLKRSAVADSAADRGRSSSSRIASENVPVETAAAHKRPRPAGSVAGTAADRRIWGTGGI